MLQELTLTPATIIILVVVAAWAVWAVRRLFFRGMCDCGDKCDGCSKASRKKAVKGDSCPHCSAADDMVANMEKSLNK